MTLLKRISAHAPGALKLGGRVTADNLAGVSPVSPALLELLNELLQPAMAERRGGASSAKPAKAHAWLGALDWEKLASGELPSPLQPAAQEQLAAKVADGPAEPLPSEAFEPEAGADVAWIELF